MTLFSLNFIDLFSGAGGLSCGLEMSGHNCLLGVDNDKWAMETFAHNHSQAKTYCGDIRQLDEAQLKKLTKGKPIHAVVGGPPCQGFSTVGIGNPKDKRNHLFLEFCRIVDITRPHFVVMENVTGLLAQKNEKTLKSIVQEFTSRGYQLSIQVLASEKYGVPERRRRTIILGSNLGAPLDFPHPTHDTVKDNRVIGPRTVHDAFKEITDHLKIKKSIPNHEVKKAKIADELDRKRVAKIPDGKGIRYEKDELAYLPPRLRLGVDWATLPENRFRQIRYQRLHSKSPSPTIMTSRFQYYHPFENRFITAREAASLQSFPLNFEFKGPLGAQWKQIGNAVPPLIGMVIGKLLQDVYVQYIHDTKILGVPTEKTVIQKLTKTSHETIKAIRKKAFVYKKPRGNQADLKEKDGAQPTH
jgi:DNA (cytosine-5)-methyltransferase 1